MNEANKKRSRTEVPDADALEYLGATVGSFANRINRGLQEKERLINKAAEAREERHAIMLRAMTTIRKALQETCKIKLGERFGFELEVSDWEGWPRVELSLIDSHAPNRSDFGMVVSADDHKERGLIGIAMKSGELLGEIELAQPEQLKKLPVILKRSVRSFLDQVGAYVLNPPKPEDLIEVSTRPIHLDNFEEQDSKAADSLAEEDVFADETDAYSPSQNVVEQDDPADYFEPLAIPTK